MPDQIALVTGGTDGIGKAVTLRLLKRGVQVIVVGRNAQKAQAALTDLRRQVPDAQVAFWTYDLSRMGDVQALAGRIKAEYDQLDMLVHCAGVMLRERVLTDEGLETVFAVQYVARYALTHALLDHLRAAPDARVVNVSAGGEINLALDFDNLQGEKHYNGVNALRHESIANDMLMLDLQAEHHDAGRFYCYGPGYVSTTLLRDMPGYFQIFAKLIGNFIGINAEQAADHVLALLTEDHEGGLYGRGPKRNTPSGFRADEANRLRLRQITETLITDALKNAV